MNTMDNSEIIQEEIPTEQQISSLLDEGYCVEIYAENNYIHLKRTSQRR